MSNLRQIFQTIHSSRPNTNGSRFCAVNFQLAVLLLTRRQRYSVATCVVYFVEQNSYQSTSNPISRLGEVYRRAAAVSRGCAAGFAEAQLSAQLSAQLHSCTPSASSQFASCRSNLPRRPRQEIVMAMTAPSFPSISWQTPEVHIFSFSFVFRGEASRKLERLLGGRVRYSNEETRQ